MVLFNITALLMMIPAVGGAYALHYFVPGTPLPALIAAAGAVAFVADLAVRSQSRQRKLLHPSAGGQVLLVPLWVVALLGIGFAVHQYIQPSSVMAGSPTHAAAPAKR